MHGPGVSSGVELSTASVHADADGEGIQWLFCAENNTKCQKAVKNRMRARPKASGRTIPRQILKPPAPSPQSLPFFLPSSIIIYYTTPSSNINLTSNSTSSSNTILISNTISTFNKHLLQQQSLLPYTDGLHPQVVYVSCPRPLPSTHSPTFFIPAQDPSSISKQILTS